MSRHTTHHFPNHLTLGWTSPAPSASPLISRASSPGHLGGPLLESAQGAALYPLQGASKWMQNSRCGLTSTQKSITPPGLLDVHLLRQPMMPLALFKQWISSRTPSSLSVELLSRNLAPGLYCGMRVFLPRGRPSCLPLLNFKSSVIAHFSRMLRISSLPHLPVHWLLPCIW